MSRSFCTKHPYLIPRLYVESLESDEYLVLEDSNAIRATRCSGVCYGKAIYGSMLNELVDLLSKKVLRSFIVALPPSYERAILVPSGSHLEPIPLEGMRVILEVCEGDKIKEGDTIGYIATSKLEVRRIRSHVEGIVVYIYSSPEARPEKNIVFIALEGDVRNVRIQYT